MTNLFEQYLQKIEADALSGQATEHTYRPALEWLLEAWDVEITAANDPKHIACGAPDFVVERRKIPLGYVETKDIGVDLNKAEKSEQLKRYRQALNNLILTDYVEFRWYVNGQIKLTAQLATVEKNGRLTPNAEGLTIAQHLFTEFYQTQVPTVNTPRDLAERMAQLAQLIRDLTANALQTEDSVGGALHKQFKTFQEYLLPDLTPKDFADIYAQTMAYGLFAARVSAPPQTPFNRASAYHHLAANRFLRKLFLDVGEGLDDTPITPFLDDLATLLTHTDLAAILQDFGKRTRTEDPVVHFYETFLAEYDPHLREQRGVYYTPEPVVQFIVNSVDDLLRERFDRPLGLAAKDVYVLDPATGTSTFLYFVIQAIYTTLQSKQQTGNWQDYAHTHLLPRLFGFEVLVAPYVIAHLKLGLLLRELGYTFDKDDRLRIFLTNALDEGVTASETLGDLAWYISQEASEAAQVKKQTPIMVVMGNPPYSNFGRLNRNAWIRGLLENYKQGLEEKKINLDDDYIKFIRFGQWRIDKTGQGILALITNNSFIDGLTHRRMRQSLLETFTDIYILNLHGSSKKQETAPDGSKDNNVFDIQQGVTISLFIKEAGRAGPAQIHYAELWGRRAKKYAYLAEHSVKNVRWKKLAPKPASYYFVPRLETYQAEYLAGWSVPDIFPFYNSAVQTKKDALTIHFTRKQLEAVLRDLKTKDPETLRRAYALGDDGRDWTVASAKKDVMQSKGQICPIQYRPFDTRWTYFTGHTKGFIAYPRADVTSQLLQPNLALATLRQIAGAPDLCEVFATQHTMTDRSLFSTLGTPYLFPLYLYPNGDYPPTLFDHDNGRRPNLADTFVAACAQKLGLTFIPDGAGDLKKTFGPEDIFHYAYAVFHSPTYRTRYAEFLKIDFPRLPLTSDKKLFAKLAAKGAELVRLHLLTSPALDHFTTTYPVVGSNTVEKISYEKKKVWINAEQYFGGVPEAAWEMQIGGYQVGEKWLKDRKNRVLTHDDITNYQRIIMALKETAHLMVEIDTALSSFPLP